MSCQICVITHIGYEAVSAAMRRAAAEHGGSFEALGRHYAKHGFIHGNSLATGLAALGYDTRQILYNLEVLQKLWAVENDLSYREASWPQEIALAQIRAWRPDIVLIQGLHRDPQLSLVPTPEFRSQCPFVRLVLAISGFPMEAEAARGIDIIAANSPELCRHYRGNGAVAELVYHAFDDRIPQQLAAYQRLRAEAAETHDFTFSGSTGLGWGWGHRSRYYDLVYLLAATGLELWGYERCPDTSLRPLPLTRLAANLQALRRRLSPPDFVGLCRRLTVTAFGSDLPALPLAAIFPDRCRGALFGTAMYDLLARSRLSFNRHTDAGGDVGNMRMFHATGLGSCLITDGGPNLRELFEPGREVVVYRGIEECAEKVRYLLGHDGERRAIAEAGRRRTLRDHTYARRCQQLDALIVGALRRRSGRRKRRRASASPPPTSADPAFGGTLD